MLKMRVAEGLELVFVGLPVFLGKSGGLST